jgi:hypothetical protein
MEPNTKDSIRGQFALEDSKAVEYRQALKRNLTAIELKVSQPFKKGDYLISIPEMDEINKLTSIMQTQVELHCPEQCTKKFTRTCCQLIQFLYNFPSSTAIRDIVDPEQTYPRERVQSWLLQDIANYKKELEGEAVLIAEGEGLILFE